MQNGMDPEIIRAVVSAALEEDAAWNDTTVSLLGIGDRDITARILSLSPGILAGMDVARAVFLRMDRTIAFEATVSDGAPVEPGRILARMRGAARGILSAERVALNFLQRLSGIATLTSRFVEKVAGTGVRILDTRKTTPLIRALEKYAVRMGGGENHRFNLQEMILVKENHIRAIGGVEALVKRLRAQKPPVPVEVEVDSLAFLRALLGAPLDRVMLDNFAPEEARKALELIARFKRTHPDFSPKVEVSGGIDLDNVGDYAISGVDFVSVGALTHSSAALNMSVEVD